MKNQIISTVNNTYEVINWKRKDGLFNVYVQRTSNLSDTYKGEASYCVGVKEPLTLCEDDILNLTYYI